MLFVFSEAIPCFSFNEISFLILPVHKSVFKREKRKFRLLFFLILNTDHFLLKLTVTVEKYEKEIH